MIDKGDFAKIDKWDFVKQHHSYLNDYIKFADAKALGVITINGLLVKLVFKYLSNDFSETKHFLLLMGAILLLLGIFFAIYMVFPRTGYSNDQGLIFWENVVAMNRENFINSVKEISEKELFEKLIEQNYFLAQTSSKKYSILRKAFVFSFIGYLLLVVSGVFWIFS
ncbi:hypothetical protein HPK02_13855 [Anoxybacillus flavithermus]|uniref:Pycsar system effector family protein n=1 Tax=Anoxybacillus flavithermus TaxID=33934 RepID=UPI0018688165|nr:hypothetical protein [Anoxybacillus flavithermus]